MACVQNPSAGVSGQRLEDLSLPGQHGLTGGFKVSEIPSPKRKKNEMDGARGVNQRHSLVSV